MTQDDGNFARPPLELSVVVPTFNERDNITELIRRIDEQLTGISWELIFVDDHSPDGTADLVRGIARTDQRIRCIERIDRRGLATACIDGFMASPAPFVAVIDADMQHDERLLSKMLETLRSSRMDIVVGSRYLQDASTGNWSPSRVLVSRLATRLSRLVLKAPLTDPLSGFFMLRRELISSLVPRLSRIGFKILLDILASSPKPLRCAELPYTFRERVAGSSKLDHRAIWDYLMLVAHIFAGRVVPARFISFAVVGGIGVLVSLFVFTILFSYLGVSFVFAQSAAALAAMTSNFSLNNLLTYMDRKLRGWDLLRGWLSFVAICSIGAIANVGLAAFLFETRVHWSLSAMAGILVGTVWNYAVTAAYTWR
jgi:dolichol-phosphate mannosyltransferase